MIAKLKIDYDSKMKKGDKFRVIEVKGKRITVLDFQNDRKVDFGFSEVELVKGNKTELSSLGQFLSFKYGKDMMLLRNGEIKKCIDNAKKDGLPITRELANEALGCYIFGNC